MPSHPRREGKNAAPGGFPGGAPRVGGEFGDGGWGSCYPTHSAKNAEWMGHPARTRRPEGSQVGHPGLVVNLEMAVGVRAIPPIPQRTRNGWGTRHPGLVVNLEMAVGVRAIPPIPQRTRNGWGTRHPGLVVNLEMAVGVRAIPPIPQRTRNGWGTRHPGLVVNLEMAVGVRAIPPIPQRTRNGWGTRQERGAGGFPGGAPRVGGEFGDGGWGSCYPTHSAKNAEWMGHPVFVGAEARALQTDAGALQAEAGALQLTDGRRGRAGRILRYTCVACGYSVSTAEPR